MGEKKLVMTGNELNSFQCSNPESIIYGTFPYLPSRELAVAVYYDWLCQFDSVESYLHKDKREGDREQSLAMLLPLIKVISEKLGIIC